MWGSDGVTINIALNKIRWDKHGLWHISKAHFTLQYSEITSQTPEHHSFIQSCRWNKECDVTITEDWRTEGGKLVLRIYIG